MNACTVLYTREAGREVGLVACESDHRISGVIRIPVGSGAHSPSDCQGSRCIAWGTKSLEQVNF